MDINIRKHIINNFKNSNAEDIRNSVEASIKDQDEITLPGLGVLFEIMWQNSTNQEEMLNSILKGLKQS